MAPGSTSYIGRFAPSPTGDLHFGSMVAAVGSYLQARRHGGRWLVRIEDIDPPREIAGSATRILAELQRLGMIPDQSVLYQSKRMAAFRDATNRLLDEGHAYHCACARSDLPANGVYPGTCRNGIANGRKPRTVRVRVTDRLIGFNDRVQGNCALNLAESCGDFVIWRADGLPAYQLAVVVDDAFQGITEIVRGADLLDSTPRQIHLQSLLNLPHPDYLHLPVAMDKKGRKLSKRTGSDPLSAHSPQESLYRALRFLGQKPPRTPTLAALWEWSLAHWEADAIPASADSGHAA